MRVPTLIFLITLVGVSAAPGASDTLNEKASKYYKQIYRFKTYVIPRFPKRTENDLRSEIINRWFDEDIEARVRWFQRQDWSDDYKAMFLRAVQWRREAFNGGAEKLYWLSKDYQNRPKAKEDGYLSLSGKLLGLAAFAGHPKALAEVDDHPEFTITPILLQLSRFYTYKDAVEGVLGQQAGLVGIYLTLPIFDIDLVKGYYWYLRVGGVDISKSLDGKWRKRLSLLTPNQRKQAEDWIKSGHIPSM